MHRLPARLTTVTTTPSSAPTAFSSVLTSPEQLGEFYRAPHEAVVNKTIDHIDDGCRSFVERSSFVLVGTSGADGALDVSPRGGPAGFVKVLDEHRIAVPDLNGNNRLDSLHNIIATGRIGMLFVIPGLGETLRVNGTAAVVTDADVLDRFVDDVRRPATAIGVTVTEAYIHCAKSFRRGSMWAPDEWLPRAERPSPGGIYLSHAGVTGVTAEQADASLEQSYIADLAADRPVATACED